MSYKQLYEYLNQCKTTGFSTFSIDEYAEFSMEAPTLFRLDVECHCGLLTLSTTTSWTQVNPKLFLDSTADNYDLMQNVLYPVWNQKIDERNTLVVIEVSNLFAAPVIYSDPDIFGFLKTDWIPGEEEWLVKAGTKVSIDEVSLFKSDVARRYIKWYKGTAQ